MILKRPSGYFSRIGFIATLVVNKCSKIACNLSEMYYLDVTKPSSGSCTACKNSAWTFPRALLCRPAFINAHSHISWIYNIVILCEVLSAHSAHGHKALTHAHADTCRGKKFPLWAVFLNIKAMNHNFSYSSCLKIIYRSRRGFF